MPRGLGFDPFLPVLLLLNGLSIAGCWWVLCRLRQFDEQVRQRVFVRQLRSLLLSSFAQHALFVPLLVLDFAPTDAFLTLGQQDRTCFWSYLGFRHFRMITVLQECHIALTFLIQALRLNKLAPLLRRSIPLVWILGLLLGLIDDTSSRWFFNHSAGMCLMDKPDQISMVLIVASFVCSLLSYIFSTFTAWCVGSPHSVVRRNYSRAAAYPLNFIVCYGLVFYAHLDPEVVFENRHFLMVACALESCNGMLNASVYWWQSRKAVAMAQRAASASASAPAALLVTNESTCPGEESGMSFRVAIGGVDVVEIQSMGLEARRRAEIQTEAISRHRAERAARAAQRAARSNSGSLAASW